MTDVIVIENPNPRYIVVTDGSNEVSIQSPPQFIVDITAPGPQGPVGQGFPSGGVQYDILQKNSATNYDASWTDKATLDAIQFDMAANETPAVGQLNWFADDGTVQVGLFGGNINLSVGQEEVARIKNTTGSTLTKGQVVCITGAQGQRLTASLASSSNEATSSKTFGIVAETIADQAEGFIATHGLLRGINTGAYAEGAAIWLASAPGTFTTSKPSAPYHLVHLGWIARQGSGSSGSIFVHIQNGLELDELHNVKIANPVAGDLLQYKSSGLWENVAESEITRRESGPQFTYSGGNLTRIDYDSGNYKLFTYFSGRVTRIDYIRGSKTIRKDFTYNLDGSLDYITESEF